jgi:hypothetical protein
MLGGRAMFYIFYSTNDVFIGEEILKDRGIEHRIVPTPIKDSVYCGVCIFLDADNGEVEKLLGDMKYITV